MKYVIVILLLFICSPAFAKQKHKHRGHSHNHSQHHSRRYSHHHRVAHHSRSHHHRKMVPHTKPRVLTVDDVLSQQFEARKGSLSLPVEGTMVHFDTATKYICYNPIVNSGIDIACRAGSCVRTVHEGTVSSIFSVDNDDKMVVIVKHGNYFTVYNSLAETSVKKGEILTANQEIGTVAVNDDGEPRLNFQIWKAAPGDSKKVKQNPEVWVLKSY